MKHKLKRLLALLLCAVMMSSPLTGLITPASAADAPGTADTPANVDLLNFREQDNGRPNLFVDFLGDNRKYQPDRSATTHPGTLLAPAGYDQSAITNPNAGGDAVTTPDADNPCNTWKLYTQNELDQSGSDIYDGGTLFWVGIGIDRKEMWEVLEGNKGLTSFEAGFYYDNRFIEPYIDPAQLAAGATTQDAYKATIYNANINNPGYPKNTQWSRDYDIVEAVTGQDVTTASSLTDAGNQFGQYDPITQEEMSRYSMEDILTGANDGDWKMTYVSLELTDLNANRRLQGVYDPPTDVDADGNLIVPPAAHGDASDNDYQYLLLIPFRLKAYGSPDYTALRLIRNATHFSVGGGEDGTDPYAAWERVTTRNPGRDIKLLNNFLGDLNLFNGGRFGEVEYTVDLEIKSDGGTWNRAELSVDGDPALYPVKATATGDVIRGLQSGIGMDLKTHTETGYNVRVTVSYPDRNGTKYPYDTIVGTGQDQNFKFVIPVLPEGGRNVHVLVEFIYDTASELNVYLSEVPQVSDPGAVYGNEATIYTNIGADGLLSTDSDGNILNPSANSYDPPSPEGHPSNAEHTGEMQDHQVGPVCKAEKDKTVRVQVKTHHDYQALVRILNFRSGTYINPSWIDGGTINTNTTSPNYLQITLPYGGTVEFTQPNSDVDVEVRYIPAVAHKATLEVWHDTANGAEITDMNTAQLAYLSYNDLDVPSTKYSGVVYEDYDAAATPVKDDHRAVKTGAGNKILGWVPTSQSALSGSLGGDSETGTPWADSTYSPVGGGYLMSQLYSSTSATAFAASFSASDISTLEVISGGQVGLRKDLQGQLYGDGADTTALAQLLWEMRQRIMADPALQAAYEKTVTLPGATTTAYTYLDLTPAQVQAYQLEILEAQAIAPKNVSEYRKTQQLYRQAEALYQEAQSTPAIAGLLPIQALSAPADMELDNTGAAPTWLRTYQGEDYQTYIDSYNDYIEDYIHYAEIAIKTGAVDTTVTFPTLTVPAVRTVALLPDSDTDADATNDAQSVVSGYGWDAPAPSTDNFIETREGRTVWVAAEGDSRYRVKDVVIRRSSDNTVLQTITAPTSAYSNVYSFNMPDEDCVVQVTYELRPLRNIQWQVVGADGETDNTAEIVAYRVTDHDAIYEAAPWNETPATTPTRHVETNKDHWNDDPYPDPAGVIRNVFVGSTITVRATHHEDYTIEVTLDEGNGTVTTLTGVAAGDPENGYIYTYNVQNIPFDAVLTVTYKPAELRTNDAVITYSTYPGDPEDPGGNNWAYWQSGSSSGTAQIQTLTNVPQGQHLTADISVAPGYYIHSVTATGASGSYPFTLAGNGYNNGYGTASVPLNLWVDMPGERLEVHVVFKKGPPPVDPSRTLTLTVKDEDNDAAPYADNWAKASVYDANADLSAPDPLPATANLTLGSVGKGTTGGGVLSDADYVDETKEQWVYLDVENVVVYKAGSTTQVDPEKSYYISSITVSPSNLGVTVEWLNPHQARFLMPHGTAGVTVEFKKFPDDGRLPAHSLIVDRTETGGDSGFKNQLTNANSATIRSWAATTTGTTLGTVGSAYPYPSTINNAGVPGEQVTVTYVVAPPDDPTNPDATKDWYVQSVLLVYGGAAFSLTATPTGNANEYTSTFTMPGEDARFVVNYRKGHPLVRDYTLTLILQDPDNDDTPADDNTLTATFTDPSHAQPPIVLGLAQPGAPMTAVTQAHAGDRLDLATKLETGYTLEFISIRPISLGLYPTYDTPTAPATQAAHFTMPAADVVVVARVIKGQDKQYTANLILRPPAGYTPDDVGQGTFASPTSGALTANYPTGAIFSGVFTPGQVVDLDLFAKDGFYIRAVTVDPANGSVTTLTGGFGSQQGTFTMPAANVNVNVWFEHKWPDEAQYNVTLRVHDAQVDPADHEKPGNYARFSSVEGVAVPNDATDNTGRNVYGTESSTITYDKSYAPYDRDTVVVAIHRVDGYYYNADTISVTDTDGNSIPWWYVPGGIAYTQPPMSVTVDVTFLPGTPTKHTATLHIQDDATGDSAQLSIHATGNAETAPDDAHPASVNTDGGQIVNLYTADSLKLTVQPGADRHVAAAYAVNKTTNAIIPLYANADATGAVTFVPGDPAVASEGYLGVPEADVDVYVRFAPGKVNVDDYRIKLMVSGPADAGYASAAIDAFAGNAAQSMTVYTPGATLPAPPTEAVHAMDSRFTKDGNQVTVTFKPADLTASGGGKYMITKLEVYDKTGKPVDYEWVSMISTPPTSPSDWYPTWTPNPELQIKLTVPIDGVTVHVTYDKADETEYRAQVVVNDEAYSDAPTPSRNNAWLRNEAIDSVQRKLQTAKAGDWIDVDVLVHPGYKIEYIKVIPQSYGIAPTLHQGPLVDQTTGFYMPPGDVTVYVKFVDDGIDEHNVTLRAVGTTAIPDPDHNYATIQSPRSGLRPNVPVNGTAQSVTARPNMDWVTVNYYWDITRNSIDSVTVKDSAGNDVPFTQELNDPATGHGRLKLLVDQQDVIVTVTYKNEPTPKPDPQGQEVVLHVIDKDGVAADPILIDAGLGGANVNYGSLDYGGNIILGYAADHTGDIGPAFHPGNSATIHVPAGETVDVTACSDADGLDGKGKVYIESAFVLYEAGGQMIEMNLTPDTPGPGFSGLHDESSFVVHPGRNDVYVTLTRKAPTQNEYSAVLMIKGPTDDCGSGAICVGSDYNTADPARRDAVTQANHGYAYVTAKTGEGITAQIVPAPGYIIDKVVVTPLGFPLTFTQSGNTIKFDMAHCNVAICVYLKQGSNQEHTVTLHYLRNDDDVDITDKATLSWTKPGNTSPTTITADLDPATTEDPATGNYGPVTSMVVTEDSEVTLDAYLQGPNDKVLAAYVLWNGTLVQLEPALEGTANTESDITKPDGTAKFTMPTGDADVYLITATKVPDKPWHTAVLIAYDYSSSQGNNSGKNEGDLASGGVTNTATSLGHPGHTFMVLSDGDNYTVTPRAAAGYTFDDPATMTTNSNSIPVNLTTTMTNPYIYNLTMGTENQAVVIHFSSDEQLKLTVEIEDPDNPGNGTVTNAVDATTTGLPTLNLISQTPAGAYQIMEGVTANDPVNLTVKPASGDYIAVAQLHKLDTGTGTQVVEAVALTKQADGTYTGSFPMPENDARVVVTFFRAYKGTLTLIDHIPGDSTQAYMEESFYQPTPKSVSVNSVYDRTKTMTDLPNGDTLTAEMVDFTPTATQKVTGLLTRKGSTTFLSATPNPSVGGADQYIHTLNRADAEITLVVDDTAVNPDAYIAAVQTVGLPAGTAAPAIATSSTGQVSGSIWTTAKSNDTVTVTFDVPAGYSAILTNDQGLTMSVPGPVAGAVTGQTSTFTMPAANVQVTITYVKTSPTLKLVVQAPAGTSNTTEVTYPGGTLTADGQTATVTNGQTITLTQAAPDTANNVSLSAAFWTADNGSSGVLGVGDSFTMPAADATVTVIYRQPGPTPDPTKDPYIALVEVNNGGDPDNRATSLTNVTTSGLSGVSPYWMEGITGDEMRVSYEIAPGYLAVVTARRADNNAPLNVSSVASSSIGSASVSMPGGTNIIITITYTALKPDDKLDGDVILQLVEHEGQAGNQADLTSPNAGTLNPATLSMDGANTPGNGVTVTTWNWPGAIETPAVSYSTMGDELRVAAHWATGSQVARMTVAVRHADNTETPEMPLTVNRYGTLAAGRTLMPYVNKAAGETAVVRVYYGNIYNATLHLVDQDLAAGDMASATDNQTATIAKDQANNVITKPIRNDLDWLDGYQGDSGEDVQTTAKAGADRRLVGVVWESDLTGAAAADPASDGTADRYDFTMPKADVDFYVVYEEEPLDPKDKTYIAKVAFASDSQHQGDSQNAVSIANASDPSASKGKYWVAAKGGNDIEVTVKVAPGYQAEIITTKIDDAAQLGKLPQINDGGTLRAPTAADDYQYYISRTTFVPNLTAGKVAQFTMPLDTDATVTVRYTKGYDLKLEVTDKSLLDGAAVTGVNEVDTAYDAAEHLQWKHDGSAAPTTKTYTPASQTLFDKDGGKSVTTDVTAYDPDVKVKVTRTTPFTGTNLLTNTAPATNYPFTMPYEDTLVSVLLQDKDAKDDLLAKVALKGDSDVSGNTATPILDHDDQPGTTQGAVWTTTYLDDDGLGTATSLTGHTIDLTLTVAKGYVAKITVRRDNDNYYNNLTDETKWDYLDAQDYQFQRIWTVADTSTGAAPGATVEMSEDLAATSGITEVQVGYSADALPQQIFPDSVGGEQHFRFTMPPYDADGGAATDVTVIVEFVRSMDIPQPFDPRNDETVTPSFLEQGFIYGENRGDFAIIEIPTLAKHESETTTKLFDTDNYTTPPDAANEDPSKDVTFEFYLRTVAADGTETYTRLDLGVDVLLTPYDPEELNDPADPSDPNLTQSGDPYNYYKGKAGGMWTGTETWKDTTPGAKTYDFVGSKFKLTPTDPVTTGTGSSAVTARTANAQKVYDMLNNKGSLETYTDENGDTQYRTQLFVMAKDAVGGESEYTEVWIRPWFALAARVVSYGPTHDLEGELYRLMTQTELDTATGYLLPDGTVNPTPPAGVTGSTPVDEEDFAHYNYGGKDTPDFQDSIVLENDAGSGKWLQTLRMRSSDLLGRYDKDYDPTDDATHSLLDNVKATEDLTYALRIKKASNLPYTRVKIDLNPNDPANTELYGAAQLAQYYDDKTRTFSITDIIQLIAGDVDGNEYTKLQDYDQVYEYVYRNKKYSILKTEPVPPKKADGTVDTASPAYPAYQTDKAAWDISVYNPKAMAYRCDLDGDRRLTIADLDIVTTRFNYNRDVSDYLWTLKTDTTKQVLPFGLGAGKGNYTALFFLQDAIDGELLGDLYWDEQVSPESTEAEPLENPVVDADGKPWIQPEPEPGEGESGSGSGEAVELPGGFDEQPEIPMGDEVMGGRAQLPAPEDFGPAAEAALPAPETPGENPEPAI